MLKRLGLAVAGLFLCLPAHAAGTVPGFNLTPQFDLTGKVAPGCKLYVIQAGTTSTPQQPYQDSGLSILAANPLTCDAAGRLPQWFVADGTIKVRLTKSDGTQIFVGDGLLVVGASSGGGGGSPVDPTTILSTGDVKVAYGTGILSGFVRMNGRTIGSATSGATERANSDVQALFVYLWGADANLAVSGGRGANAAADWSANKTIALPDGRARALSGLSDMGNSDSGLLSALTFTSGNATTIGSRFGAATTTMARSDLPNTNATVAITDPGHTHTITNGTSIVSNVGGSLGLTGGPGTVTATNLANQSATTGISATVNLNGNVTQTAMSTASLSLLITYYLKL
jgi:hypothetical protein